MEAKAAISVEVGFPSRKWRAISRGMFWRTVGLSSGVKVRVAATVVGECGRLGVPLVLEPLFHSLHDPADRERVVLATVDHFADTGADLLKLPFPVDPELVTNADARADVCTRVTERCVQPWAILSGGGAFESFAEQVAAATIAGAAGFMVGRALWGEAARAADADRPALIAQVVVPRWQRLAAVARRPVG